MIKMAAEYGAHPTHCCKKHGCKYAFYAADNLKCPVVSDVVVMEHPLQCEQCYDDAQEEHGNVEALEAVLADMQDVADDRSVIAQQMIVALAKRGYRVVRD